MDRIRRVLSQRALLGLALGLSLAVLAGGCHSSPDIPMPPELIGVWRTDAVGYRHRKLEIRENVVKFGTGEFSHDTYLVERVEVLPDSDGWSVVRIHLREQDDDIAPLDLAYRTEKSPTLRFPNRPQIWTPAKRGSSDHG